MGLAGTRLRFASVWVARGVLSLLAGALGFAACGGSSRSTAPPGASTGGAAGQVTGGAADVVIGRTDGGTGAHAISGGGTAGAAGDAASAGDGGFGPSPAHGGPPLGRACSSDDDCEDLKCVRPTDTTFTDHGAPPNGLCTLPCQLPTVVDPDDPCQAIDPNAMCYPVDQESSTGYCIEGCAFGPPDAGQAKCHDRAEFACSVAFVQATKYPCLEAVDCEAGEYCGSEGYCQIVLPGCLPSCRGDLDCAPGLHCDQAWLTGTCVKATQTGKPLSDACTVPPIDQPLEPDECLGYCGADASGSSQGHCLSLCPFGEGCDWDPATERFNGACILTSQVVGQSGTPGDFGFCNQTCNCSDDCLISGDRCVQYGNRLGAAFGGPGLCLQPVRGDKFIEACLP